MAGAQELQVQQKREVEKKTETTTPARVFVPVTDIFETPEALTVVLRDCAFTTLRELDSRVRAVLQLLADSNPNGPGCIDQLASSRMTFFATVDGHRRAVTCPIAAPMIGIGRQRRPISMGTVVNRSMLIASR